MSPQPDADPTSVPADSDPPAITIRRLEWEPDEQLSARTWAYTALVDGRPIAVQAVVFRADRSLLYLTPDLKFAAIPPSIVHTEIVRLLAERVQNDLAGLDILFQQAVIEREDEIAAIALDAAGFRPITDVCELSMTIAPDSAFEASSTRKDEFELVAPPLDSPLWVEAFASSLEGGLDVPELLEKRSPAESFDSLRLLAADDTEHWRVASHRGAPVGLVLPTRLPDRTAEIQYMGVASAHRRKGLGRCLIADAVDATRALEATVLTVHVDARNEPALRLYESEGFRLMSRRQLHLR